MMHWHRWQLIHEEVLPNKRASFRHEHCSKCGKDRVATWLGFFSSINDAIAIGIAAGLYEGMRKALKEQGYSAQERTL